MMYPVSVNFIWAFSIFMFSTASSSPLLPSGNLTFFGDAFLNNDSIVLTKESNCSSVSPPISGVGRAFYSNPVRFFDVSKNYTASFFCSFSFSIRNNGSCPFGDGLAFLITSNPNLFSLYDGYIGLPSDFRYTSEVQDSYVAVEFDTSFDSNLGDINGNHVGIDVNKVISQSSVDIASKGIDLKSGNETSAWIEYRDSEKMIRVWLGYSSQLRPPDPVLVAEVDLSYLFKEFMHVGFSASNNGKGSSLHMVNRWRFKTFFGLLPATPMDIVEDGSCYTCAPVDSNIEFGSFNYHTSNKRVLKIALLLCILALIVVFVAAIVTVFCVCFLRRRRLRRARSERHLHRFHGGRMVPQMLSLNEIKSATNGFDQDKIIGAGASAVVYEGAIPSCGSVAIKRFNYENKYDASVSQVPFNTEFTTMAGCLRHKNLVQLQGWCCERNELVLVYEYMANGSLDRILHYRTNLTKFLTWERRLNIILGVASAIIYLHEECESQIIHRDVKTCNILLDSEFNAKLGDFGLAEVHRHSFRARDATVPAGTMGYLAPEYVFSGVPTVKTDVYSFGVVVLEVASGRRPVDKDSLAVADYVWDLWEKGAIVEAADPKLMNKFSKTEMETALIVGLSCANPDCDKRPTMREAARMLKGESLLPTLPSRKPTVKIQSILPEGCEEIMNGGHLDDTPWSTPRTHFSRN